ncbi:MAG: ABC transporter ATP-binding protein [Methylovirgula sp.]|uniref:ABC transporter ATP-binding protein n=1 Tax=Methylovirgula sp. TaxID=1978224 RepID=UPI00307618C2
MSAFDIGGRGGGGIPNHGELGEEIFAAFNPRIVRRFLGFVKPYRWQVLRVLAAVMIFVGTQVSIPLAIRSAVDDALGRSGHVPYDFIMLGFLVLVIVNAVSSFFQERSAAILAQRVIFDLRRAMFVHLQHVPMSFYDRTHAGRVMSRIQGDVNSLQEFLETSVQSIGDSFLLVGITIVLIAMDWRLALLTLTSVPVLVAIRAVWLPWAKKAFRLARDASSIVNATLAENIAGVRTVQEAQREVYNLAHFQERAQYSFRAQIRSAWAAQIMIPTVDILTGIAQAIVVIVGGASVMSGHLALGVMIAFIFYVQRFFDPIRTLSLQYTVLQRAMAAGHRIFEVLDVPTEATDTPNAVTLADFTPSVELRNVTFGYKAGAPILHNLSLKVEPCQVVALVGQTGSGKTSVTALVHRFYDVWSGAVLVGGHNVKDITRDSLGRAVAMVLQEPFLFSGSIFENIRYSSVWATRDDVVAAAQAVCAHEFIMKLPEGYDTNLGQRGQNLSIGQRQLLSFARALVADPKILILDEATASIDSFTEQSIQAALRVLLKGRTSIVIAHRLATVRDADNIIVLRNGAIAEQGDHESLLRQGGLYAGLWQRNYASFDDQIFGALDVGNR